ncbi:hypothetical protein CEXT_147171 [Caerostris extrusa]|uniref:Uncharacterized protein n=1 Tax=Caerostris extrusa TaxID=172846 RepID=A0AAV4Y1K3_CAEEX|nr:hypothetical protein CEXT_147171 [Caerostris extrusa]
MAKVASTNGATNVWRVKADDPESRRPGSDLETWLRASAGIGAAGRAVLSPHKGDLESRLLNPLTRVRRTAAAIQQAFFLVYFGNATTLFSQGTENKIISLLFKENKYINK